jgi:hypothetical protein
MDSDHPPHWDLELDRVLAGARGAKPDALIGVAVDDVRKRDYFVQVLQTAVNRNAWAERLTFRVTPMLGGSFVDVKRTSLH